MIHALPKGLLFLLLSIFLSFCSRAQEAKIKVEEQSFHFGIIAEEKGNVEHSFIVENSGGKPLVIARVSADCGCTSPSWPREAIEPGQKAEIRVSYDPIGRPGPFRRVMKVYSNAAVEPFELIIEGTVSSLSQARQGRFSEQVGQILLGDTELSFPISELGAEAVLRLQVKNTSEKKERLQVRSHPSFVRLDKQSLELEPDQVAEIYMTLQTPKAMKPGMHWESLKLRAKNAEGKDETKEVQISLPLVDNFETLPSSEQGSLSMSTFINLGQIEQTKLRELKVDLKNEGSGKLHIHSVTLSSIIARHVLSKSTIEAGDLAVLKLIIDPALIIEQGWKSADIDVCIICSDPKGPERHIKVKLRI